MLSPMPSTKPRAPRRHAKYEDDPQRETPTGAIYPPTTARARIEEGEAKRQAFLDAIARSGRVWQALEDTGISETAYRKWRERYPGFRMRVDQRKAEANATGKAHKRAQEQLAKGFAAFRLEYFGNESPDFHLEVVDVFENSEPGSVTLILMPPEHGKTTLVEDFCNYKLAEDPEYRITVGSQGRDHASNILGRVRDRMEPDGPCRQYVIDFGPFRPDTTTQRKKQPWADTKFTVYKKKGDQRDPSMQALGIDSAIQGKRADLLIIDDVQGKTNLDQTVKILERLRQDWLTRSGSKGRAVIIGTRVGPNDVYAGLMESNLVNRVIEYPAYDGPLEAWTKPQGVNPKNDPGEIPWNLADKFLWKEHYSPKDYLIMRVNAGEEAWLRNYMQKGEEGGTQAFTNNMLAAAARPFYSCAEPWHAHLKGEIVAAIDPGYGVNAVMAALMTTEFLLPLRWRLDFDLTNTQQIWQILDDLIYDATALTEHRCTELVIEDKAFQRGLLDDAGLHELERKWNFSVYGHQTGSNKYDPNLGIPQMARSFERSEILLPGADDERTTRDRSLLDGQMTKWRPYKKGNRLTQDLVITLWFCWMTWRRVRTLMADPATKHEGWQSTALPYAPTTSTGLVLPTGRYGLG